MLNGKYHLYVLYPSGRIVKVKYIPTAYCDNDYLYCYVRGKYTHDVLVADLILDNSVTRKDDA